MTQHRYEENEELMKLVWDCIRKLLSTKEALAELKEKGFPMNEKKYYRIKKRIDQIYKEKISIIASTGKDHSVIESIEILIRIRDEILEIARKETDVWKKLNAYSLVIKIQNELAKFYDAAIDIGKFLNSK